jgi:hypothetical protein
MHPTITYQLVQERIAELHRQVRNESRTSAATWRGPDNCRRNDPSWPALAARSRSQRLVAPSPNWSFS